MTFISLSEAMERFGVEERDRFIRSAKKHRCFIKSCGIIRIDAETLAKRLDEEFEAKAANREEKKTSLGGSAHELGLVNARISKYDSRRKTKIAKIDTARSTLSLAKNAHDKGMAQKAVAKLEAELQRLDGGYARDIERRDQILNSGDTPESTTIN